jgi:AraC-like DNA-binding protein
MSSQLIIFLLLFGAVQDLLLSVFFVRRRLYSNGYVFLLIYLMVMLLQITLKVMNKLWLMENLGFLYTLAQYLPLLYGPLVYLFVRFMLERRQFNRNVLWHFAPFSCCLLVAILDSYALTPTTLNIIFFNPSIRLAILCFSIIYYHLLSFRTWQQQRARSHIVEASFFHLAWLRQFILVSFTVCLLVSAVLYLLYVNYPAGHQYRYGFAGLTVFIYWISYTALSEPVMFSVFKQIPEKPDHFQNLVVHMPVKKYANSTLDDTEKQSICTALDQLMRQNKVYLDAELTIDRLALIVPCSRHALSQVLNECMKQSFYDYINCHRVEAAKELLAGEERKDHKIASIAYDSGFNSISTFNEVFKKFSGCTPSQFRRYPGEFSKKQRV